ncbi:protein-export chaperone SecB [Acinetobacter pittii]|uniref:protein-export chaperone SecB n=1 Tax=Acinetobacter pittii TaxID=48296 RepID=UPI002A6A4CE1|nr:protein-export chaperone SecB [Acinetobacter pittii]WPP70579.1 protein-export chaperone SecB [Acinetobacter pittii]
MNISLVSTKALKIDLEPLLEEDIVDLDEEFDFRFDYSAHRPDRVDVKNSFAIAFKALLQAPKDSVQCSIVFLAQFHTDTDFEDDFLETHFALINAPAIGYPFLRAFIANIFVNAGYEPLMLPTINFVNLYKNKIKDSDSRD